MLTNDQPLQDQIVLIPGASRSIGRHIARKFADMGCTLIVPWYDWPESVEEMSDEFTNRGYNYFACRYDLRNIEEVKALSEEVINRFGRLDYLINNIERGGMPVVHGSYDLEHNINQWDLEIETTLKAKWNLYHCLSPLIKSAVNGAVVNISSIASETGRCGEAACFFNDAYSAANRGVRTFTENWARESAPEVRVNEVMLGLVRSRHGENTRGWTALTGRQKQDLRKRILLKRTGREDEVADLVYFIAVHATYMTGAIIRMDGGYILGGDIIPPMPPGIL